MSRLAQLTRVLLDSRADPGALRSQVIELTAILSAAQSSVTKVREGIEQGETRTPEGLAVSPNMAIMCADDYMRTIRFLRGTYDAVLDARAAVRDRPVHVLYVGCGPLATLAVPLMSILPPDEVRFTLIDIHDRSIAAAREVVNSLGYADSVTAFEVAEAAHYQVSSGESPDLILLEIMQACLNSEPQVAVTRHLLEQAPDAVLIPEEVRIELMLVDLSREFSLDVDGDGSAPIQRDRVPVATVFTLNRSSVKSWVGCAVDRLPAARVQLPQRFEPNRQLMLFTIVRVYGDHLLRDYESGLTCPRYFAFDGAIEPGDVVQFQYALGQNPGLRTSMAGTTDSVASTSSKTVSSA